MTEGKEEAELAYAIAKTDTGIHAIICPTQLSDTKFGRPPMKPMDIEGYVAKWRDMIE